MEWIVAQRHRLRSLFGSFFGPEVVTAVLELARPALRLTAARAAPLTGTRLGGDPVLPAGADWPSWAGRPLDFLGVIDFAELAAVLRLPELPAAGSAAFYYAAGTPRPWGDDPAQRDGWRVVVGGGLERTGSAAGPVLPLSAEPFLSLPAPQEPVLARLEADYAGVLPVYEQLYAAWAQFVWPDEPMHQVGGWPALVLPPMTEDDRSPLLQLDSDERLGWHWGDPGRIFFRIRENEPVDHAWLTLQAR
ncbi:hypothetical protein DPM19_25505 [Actinomadura craniellae]|uniref:DUF1963 domain-containing protein n=1 Tax=Actinomadura craniellae TaxID=2231787 RepID=A0A365H2P6_9ACTN|nr:YwqG family protein [Actinomadura craniellae]RAY12493.1 hypothetical protein DPM19_25505 [Actinomadura craniellae]